MGMFEWIRSKPKKEEPAIGVFEYEDENGVLRTEMLTMRILQRMSLIMIAKMQKILLQRVRMKMVMLMRMLETRMVMMQKMKVWMMGRNKYCKR